MKPEWFKVYDNGRLAIGSNIGLKGAGWDCAIYDTFEGAKAYAMKWLGVYSCMIEDWDGPDRVDYSGYGDTLEIKAEPL